MTDYANEPQTAETPPEPPEPTVHDEPEREPLPDAPPSPGPFEARAGSYFRNVRYGLSVLIFAAGLWFLYDGFVKWPEDSRQFTALQGQIDEASRLQENERVGQLREEQEKYTFHESQDILLNRLLGIVLPPVAVLLLVRWIYISRGRVHLDADDTLHVPGEQPIPASSVTQIDDARWDRKGISLVSFDKPGGGEGRVKLDDFVYEGKPIKHIHDRLVSVVADRDAHGARDAGSTV